MDTDNPKDGQTSNNLGVLIENETNQIIKDHQISKNMELRN